MEINIQSKMAIPTRNPIQNQVVLLLVALRHLHIVTRYRVFTLNDYHRTIRQYFIHWGGDVLYFQVAPNSFIYHMQPYD